VRHIAYNQGIVSGCLPQKLVPENAAVERRWKCVCAYDGTDFSGWQSQANGNGVQDYIEKRLAQIFKKPVRIHGSGRTDAGVHAKAQVFHFDAGWPHDTDQLLRAFRCGLPAGIQVRKVSLAPTGFHARYGAIGKQYRYRIHLGRADPFELRWYWSMNDRALDLAAMRKAASYLLGKHDFSAFAAKNGDQVTEEDVVKDLRRLDLVVKGKHLDVVTQASGYLYKMVRTMVGALVETGLGKLTPEQVHDILLSKKRTYLVPTAPAQGLRMERVFYARNAARR